MRPCTAPDLDALCRLQDGGLLAKPGTAISYLASPPRQDAATRIRRAFVPQYKGLEITGFVEFPEFIFFSVFHCDAVRETVTLRKLRGLMREVKQLKITSIPNLAVPRRPLRRLYPERLRSVRLGQVCGQVVENRE